MATISVPLTTRLERSVDNLVKKGIGVNKADVIRKAIARLIEDEAVMAVLATEREAQVRLTSLQKKRIAKSEQELARGEYSTLETLEYELLESTHPKASRKRN